MKRNLSLVLAIAMMISVMAVGLFSLTASAVESNTDDNSKSNFVCDGINHVYDNKNISSQYLQSEATCVDRAVYYYSCSCGVKGTQTFTSGSPLGHSYGSAVVENLPNGSSLGNTYQICSRCSYKNTQLLSSCSTCEGDGKVSQSKDCPQCINGTEKTCSTCNGSGNSTDGYYGTCRTCNGSGYWLSKNCIACGGTGERFNPYGCWDCNGTGRLDISYCYNCNATGNITVQVNCSNCSGEGYHKRIEVKFDWLGGSNGPTTQVSTSNKLTISSKKPVKTGYVFVGWNTLENDKTIYAPGSTYSGDSTTFFAMWLPACAECGGQGYFTSQSTCPTCNGLGSYQKLIYRCGYCKSTSVNHIVGLGRVCNVCGSYDVSYVRTDTVTCSKVVQNSSDCTACSATGYVKVIAPTLVDKTSTQVELLLIEGMEYSRNGTTWQSSNIFTGLSPATNYTFYQRVANNGSVPFGATSESLTVMTACASEEAHNKNSKCVCTICGIESHSLNENCICTACGAEKHALDKNCICISCGIEKHSLDAECICTECGAEKHSLSAYCVCLGCGTPFHQFKSDTCSKCNGSTTDWDGSVATSFERGSGTSTDPYIISTGAQLAYLASQVNAGTTYKDCYFELANDVNLRGIDWNPIGNGYNNYYFGGIFDGKGCVIDNLTITKSYKSVGLFGLVGRAKISNIGVENININSTYSSSVSAVGGLVGFAQESTISNCYTKGTVYGANNSSGSSAMVGGLIGRLYGSSSIVNSYSNITVSGTSNGWNTYVGGLIGYLECQNAADIITIANCYTVSTVRSVTYKSNCYAEAGGMIAIVDGYGMVNISKCFAECNVSGAGTYIKTDGFLAINNNTLPTFRDCYYVCYSTGCNYSGVFVSTNENFKTATWLTETLGWDLLDTWRIGNNQYPTLKAFPCDHSFTDKYTTHLKSAATCTAPAVYYTSCEICEEKGTDTFEIGDALGHTEVIDEAVAPTCTTTGLTEGKHCSVCNEALIAQIVVDALGHTEGTAVVENRIESTCTTNGSYDSVVYCLVCCNELSRESKTIDLLDHNYSDEWTVDVEPNCTTTGSKSHHCLICDDIADVTIIPAGGHTYDDNSDVSCNNCGEIRDIETDEPTEYETIETTESETTETTEPETTEATESTTTETTEPETTEATESTTTETTEPETTEATESETIETTESETIETTGSETTDPATKETTEVETNGQMDNKPGCGGSISGSSVVFVALIGFGALQLTKKKKQD